MHHCIFYTHRNTKSLIQNSPGISFKTQALYALVFCTRYLDLLTHYVSLYNSVMKIFFIGTSFYILYLMKVKFRATWDPNLDTFRVEYLIAPCALMCLLFNYAKGFDPIEVRGRTKHKRVWKIHVRFNQKDQNNAGTVGFFHMARIRSDSSAALPTYAHGGGRNDYYALPVCIGRVSGPVHP